MKRTEFTDAVQRIADALRRALDMLERDEKSAADYKYAAGQIYYVGALADCIYYRLLPFVLKSSHKDSGAPICLRDLDIAMVDCLCHDTEHANCPHRFINGQCELCGTGTFPP